MSWFSLAGIVAALAAALAALVSRRVELVRMARSVDARATARERGSHRARLQFPDVDLARCIGCGICVEACPEEGVLDIVHGQALVVHGARCVGHGACARECPVGAIAVTLGDLSQRDDIPALTSGFEAAGVPGLFLAGEITGYALIRTAIAHGTAIAHEVARRVETQAKCEHPEPPGVHELCIVGAGPAGIACSLEAKARGLDFMTLEQEALGGTVSKYPRRKLVMTQPVELPLHGRLARTSYEKEELMELWERMASEHGLPIRTGATFTGLERDASGLFHIPFGDETVVARNVCLALGRRGSPRKLGVPGEELPKVAYGLVDAATYRGRRILVVGGGDSAIEAAIGLAEQPGNVVTLSYRKHAFFRIKARNEARLLEATQAGKIDVFFSSTVRSIGRNSVELEVQGEPHELPNDEVFVLAGGVPPFELLSRSGVSFDPEDRPAAEPAATGGTGLLPALATALVCAAGALAWAFVNRDYYGADAAARAAHPLHELLRPSRGLGLGLGIGAAALIAVNLAYLLRRAPRVRVTFGSLRTWMTSHVATGLLALILALMHAGLEPRQTVGGHALAALGVLIVTGAIGRYFYAFVPRAANGRELALDEVKDSLAGLSAEWERSHREFGARVRDELQALIDSGRWNGSTLSRLAALVFGQGRLRRTLAGLRSAGEREGVAPEHLSDVLALARKAHRSALMAAHYEDLRGLMASWRYLHRWVALAMVLLVVAHVVTALRFGGMFAGGAS